MKLSSKKEFEDYLYKFITYLPFGSYNKLCHIQTDI